MLRAKHFEKQVLQVEKHLQPFYTEHLARYLKFSLLTYLINVEFAKYIAM